MLKSAALILSPDGWVDGWVNGWVDGWMGVLFRSDNKAKLSSISTAIASWNWAWQHSNLIVFKSFVLLLFLTYHAFVAKNCVNLYTDTQHFIICLTLNPIWVGHSHLIKVVGDHRKVLWTQTKLWYTSSILHNTNINRSLVIFFFNLCGNLRKSTLKKEKIQPAKPNQPHFLCTPFVLHNAGNRSEISCRLSASRKM